MANTVLSAKRGLRRRAPRASATRAVGLYINGIMERFRAEDVAEGAFTLNLDECGASPIELHAPLNGLAFMMQDVVVAQLAMGSTLAGADAAKAPQDDHDGTTVKFRTLSTSAAGAIDALLSEMSARRVHFASGVVTNA
ncbi:receptor-type adenylate cyclase [Trypanosoma cruzi]|nr:receptor-type adenylate cyclase [Trypanosoma cruzi]